jgi:hypothetical protein
MPSFAGKRLVALALVTAIQILPLRPALAYPIHHAPLQSSKSSSTTSNTGTELEMLTNRKVWILNRILMRCTSWLETSGVRACLRQSRKVTKE